MRFSIMILVVVVLMLLNIFIGSVHIPFAAVIDILLGGGEYAGPAQYIIVGSRLPQAVTALLGGAGLAISGLMLQTTFRNPLAGPSILGISSGASLGVAVVMLFLGGTISAGTLMLSGYAAVMFGAFIGSMLIMALLLLLSTWLKNDLMLLITGIMIGYLASSLIMLLNFSASAQGVQNYVMWGMGSFNGVTLEQLPLFSSVMVIGLIFSLLLVKPLNLLLLGDSYARNLGVNLVRVRNMLMLATGLLTAVVTAYCGPVSFIGLAVPHITRMIWRTDNHAVIMPGTILTGGAVALLCNLISILPENSVLPINAVTPLIGAPVIIYVILKRRR